MRIPLSGLNNGPRKYQHTGTAAQYVDEAVAVSGDLSISAILSQDRGVLHLDLDADLTGQFVCDRCGVEFSRQVIAQDEFFYVIEAGSARTSDPDAGVIPKGATEIDISQEIRDLVILGLPFRSLCREDCKGLCPDCGANLNEEVNHNHETSIDPRWEALKKIKDS